MIDIMLEYVKLINLKGKDHLEKASVLKILLKIQEKKIMEKIRQIDVTTYFHEFFNKNEKWKLWV